MVESVQVVVAILSAVILVIAVVLFVRTLIADIRRIRYLQAKQRELESELKRRGED